MLRQPAPQLPGRPLTTNPLMLLEATNQTRESLLATGGSGLLWDRMERAPGALAHGTRIPRRGLSAAGCCNHWSISAPA